MRVRVTIPLSLGQVARKLLQTLSSEHLWTMLIELFVAFQRSIVQWNDWTKLFNGNITQWKWVYLAQFAIATIHRISYVNIAKYKCEVAKMYSLIEGSKSKIKVLICLISSRSLFLALLMGTFSTCSQEIFALCSYISTCILKFFSWEHLSQWIRYYHGGLTLIAFKDLSPNINTFLILGEINPQHLNFVSSHFNLS